MFGRFVSHSPKPAPEACERLLSLRIGTARRIMREEIEYRGTPGMLGPGCITPECIGCPVVLIVEQTNNQL
jgi:hypothetical protein